MNPIDNSKIRLRKFHVGTGQTDEEIIEQFVVRHNELNTVLEVLDGNINAESCQHQLIVAPRGRGKSTLLVRVIAELRSNQHFSRHLLPVRLMEESQEIFTLADFWLECLYYLAKACAEIDRAIAKELTASHAALSKNWNDPALESRARAATLDAADRLDRKLVIMVENLQLLCEDADTNFGWDLRQVLQSEPQIILLATATSRFAALDDAKEPFFELFRTLCLPPLDAAECCRLWQSISGEQVDEHSIKPLLILTGGSPRLMVVLAGFTRDRSLRQLMEQLVELIDDHTEYFRGHIEELASKERRVYIALIDLWQASTAAEIAARARMEIRSVSALLGRLVARGAVMSDKSGSKKIYFATERLYSIYYKLRRDRDEATVVRNLIHFMATYYHGDTLVDLSRRFVDEAAESEGIRQGLIRAATEIPELQDLVKQHGMSLPTSSSWEALTSTPEELDEVKRNIDAGDYDAAISLIDQLLDNDQTGDPDLNAQKTAKAINWKGFALIKKGELTAAIENIDWLISHFADSENRELQVQVAKAMVNKAITLGQLDDLAAAIENYDLLICRFVDSEDRELQVLVATAMWNKAFTLGQQGDLTAEIENYDLLITRFADSEDRELLVLSAKAMVNKAFTLWQQDDLAAAIESCDLVISRFADSEDPELQIEVAKAMVNKATKIEQQGDLNAAIENYELLITRFTDSEDRKLQELIARAIDYAAGSLCINADANGALQKVQQLRGYMKTTGIKLFELDASWIEAMARILLDEMDIVEKIFREIYASFNPGDEDSLRDFQKKLPLLVALGATPEVLATVLEEEEEKHESLKPLVVALRLEAGEQVRAPAEMLEVAADIRATIERLRQDLKTYR